MNKGVTAEEFSGQIRGRKKKLVVSSLMLSSLIVVAFFLCLFLGSVNLSFSNVFDVLMGHGTWSDTYIVMDMRMPRTICAGIVGAGLSIAGMAMQAMFRNPMASPSILGLSSGAAFGACLALGLGFGGVFGLFALPFVAFIFCFVTMFTVYLLASTRYGVPTVLLLLAGIAVGAFFGGMTSLVQYGLEQDALASVVYWAMGSFGRCDWSSVLIALAAVGTGIVMIVLFSKEMNLISMGEEQAKTLGIDMRTVRIVLLIGTSLAVGGSVAVSGIIGFVGLIIPHVCRAIVGPNHVYLWPICILTGAVFLMLMDLASRTILPTVIPIGILTALIGAPFFIYIMRKKRNELWG